MKRLPEFEEEYERLRRRIVPQLLFNQAIYEKVLHGTVSDKTVWLDAGCGHKLLPSWRSEAEDELLRHSKFVCGCDRELEVILQHTSIRHCIASDLLDLPFKSQTFNLVTCNMVVAHLENPKRVFKEFVRVLQLGGRLIIHTPYRWSYYGLLTSLMPDFIKRRLISKLQGRPPQDFYPVRYKCNTEGALRKVLQGLGLQEESSAMLASDAVFQFLASNKVGRILLRGELLLIKLSLRPQWRFLRVSICAVHQKPGELKS